MIVLNTVPYIYYPVQFKKGVKKLAKDLIHLDSMINIMTTAYAKQLGLQTRQTKVPA